MNCSASTAGTGGISAESIGWGVSTAVHAVGALAAWMAVVGPRASEAPKLPGHTTAVELVATWSEPYRPETLKEFTPLETHVLVLPDRAQIDRRTFVPRATDVRLPAPAEVAMVEPAPRQPVAVAGRHAARSTEESRVSEVPPAERVPRRAVRADIPVAELQMPASSPPQESVGTSQQTVPRPLSNRPPSYPPQAVINGQQGTVLLRVHITAAGEVADLEVISSSGHAILDAAAVRAVRRWRFEPARRDGRPVAAVVRLPIRFALE